MIDTETLAARWGFLANPFREPVAEREQNRDSFFVRPPYFTEILGDLKKLSSSFVFGYRGDGKSMLRLAMQQAFEVAASRYIVIDYTTFGGVTRDDAKAMTPHAHLDAIFRSVVDRLLTEAIADSAVLGSLTQQELATLRWFVLRYAPGGDWRASERKLIQILSKSGKARDLKQLGLTGFRHSVSFLRQKRQEIERRMSSGEKGIVLDTTMLVLTLLAPELPGSEQLRDKDIDGLLAEMVALVRRAGFVGIVVCVDRVDEAPSFGSDPKLATDFIRPLATALTLLEAEGFAVKFFLPWEVYERLRTDIRSDRLRTRVIQWQDTALRELLRRRLLAFSMERVASLDDRLDEAIRPTFYEALFHYSAGNPRNMLRLLDMILTELADSEEDPNIITEAAARRGIEKFFAMRSRESDGDAYSARLAKRGQPPPWTLTVT